MTHLYLVRHGNYMKVEHDKFIDGRLSPKGVQQVERLRDRLLESKDIKIDVLISSTMQRAQHTAEVIAPALGLPIILEEDVEEWRNEDGSLTEEEFITLWRDVPAEERPFFRWVHGCENWMEFIVRTTSALHRIIHEHDGKHIMIVCHGGIIEASFVYFFQMSMANLRRATVDARHTSITHWHKAQVEGFPAMWLLERYNDTQHLDDFVSL
ncbi:MAG TPA: histidine phosphatase family protein [Ktedonobacteraceae bacterium]|nr:histidine phosphatase family protein [Ktedonobacteraceae bacterium]